MKNTTRILIALLICNFFYGQTIEEINNATGINKASLIINYASKNLKNDPAKCIELLNQANTIGVGEENKEIQGYTSMLLSKGYYDTKEFSKALTWGQNAEKFINSQDKNYLSTIGIISSSAKNLKKYDIAIQYLIVAFNISKDYSKALEIASVYSDTKNYKEAIKWYDNAIGNTKSDIELTEANIYKGLSLANYGNNTDAIKTLKKAKQYTTTQTKINEIDNYIKSIQENELSKENVATTYDKEVKEIEEEKIALILNLNAKSLEEIEKMSEAMQLVELKIKAQADEYEKELLQEKLQTQQANEKLNLEKLEKQAISTENELIKQQKIATDIELSNKKLQIFILIISLFLIFGVVIFTIIILKKTKQTNKLLNDKNNKIINQNKIIVKQSSDILESLHYAMSIQTSVLPSKDKFLTTYERSFILHKPKDVVSGDFFWYHKTDDHKIIIASADCTGHGVPGAIMTIICSQIMDKIVIQNEITLPNEILELASSMLTEKITSNDVELETFKGGMDIAIATIDLNNNELYYSGARNPIYIVRHNKLIELKGTRRSITVDDGKIPKPTFKLDVFKLKADDNIYLFTDGFPDQKGGLKGNKYFYQPFKDLLLKLSTTTEIDQQGELLFKEFEKHKGDTEQIDDVLIIGIEIEDTEEVNI